MSRFIYNTRYSERYTLLVLFCIVLLSLVGHGASYIIITLAFVALFCIASPTWRVYYDKNCKSILAFSIIYTLIPVFRMGAINLPYAFYFVIAPSFYYMYGKYLVETSQNKNDLIDSYIPIVVCYSWVVIKAMYSSESFIMGSVADERILSFTEDGMLAATVVGLIISLCFIGLPCALYLKTNLIRRVVLMVMFVAALSTTIYFLNRGGLVVAVTSLLMATLYKFKGARGGWIKLVLLILIIISVFLFLVRMNILSDVVAGYDARNEDLEYGGGRIDRWQKALGRLFVHPFGWAFLDPYFVHNMWLDIARTAGIIPFIISIKITIDSIKSLIVVWKAEATNTGVVLISSYFCLFTACFFEPALNAISSIFFLFLLVCGGLKQYSNQILLLE